MAHMIVPYTPFRREEPTRDAKKIFIFCEGAKREKDYFDYFVELDSRINLVVYGLKDGDDNSPLGLLKIAEKHILGDQDENIAPYYNFVKDFDEVWIVVDVDMDKSHSRSPQFKEIKEKLKKRDNWHLTISNPCFEVWLYYHIATNKPDVMSEKGKDWKEMLNDKVSGGFDSRRHPLLIETASFNAKRNFSIKDDIPDLGSTEVYKFADSILPLIKHHLNKRLEKLKKLKD